MVGDSDGYQPTIPGDSVVVFNPPENSVGQQPISNEDSVGSQPMQDEDSVGLQTIKTGQAVGSNPIHPEGFVRNSAPDPSGLSELENPAVGAFLADQHLQNQIKLESWRSRNPEQSGVAGFRSKSQEWISQIIIIFPMIVSFRRQLTFGVLF